MTAVITTPAALPDAVRAGMIPDILRDIDTVKRNLNNFLDDGPKFEEQWVALDNLNSKLGRARKIEATMAGLAEPSQVNPTEVRAQDDAELAPVDWYSRNVAASRKALGFKFSEDKHFRTFGNQLASLVNYGRGGQQDPRLQRAPIGAGEVDPSGGGFLVQTDFANVVMTRMYTMGEVAGRVDKLPGLSGSSIKIPAIDETSRAAGSRYGGVLGYWVAEGTAPTASNIKVRQIELDLKKVGAIYYASDELLTDTNLYGAIATRGFAEELTFQVEDAYWEGTGAGQPLGIMNAPCKIAVAKEVGQAAGTIVYENILKMWSRMWGRSRANSAWFINQDCEPQLYALSQVIGTAGVPVYLPPNGLSGNPYGVLFGRPVIPVEYASTLGTEGDIVLADFSQYVAVDKGGVQAASSMHVQFLTDQMAFRMFYRVDGEPWWSGALTPFKGTATKSPFVTLATR